MVSQQQCSRHVLQDNSLLWGLPCVLQAFSEAPRVEGLWLVVSVSLPFRNFFLICFKEEVPLTLTH